MRELKFRCYYKIDNTMLEVTEINFTGNAITPTCIFWSPELGLHEAPIEFERDFELMQFTGLKDKNGVEIFEGDIVKFTNKKGVEIISEVVFYDGVFELTNYDYRNCTDESCINCYELLKWVACDCEVVGNIHQNKEFLNGK